MLEIIRNYLVLNLPMYVKILLCSLDRAICQYKSYQKKLKPYSLTGQTVGSAFETFLDHAVNAWVSPLHLIKEHLDY